MFKLIASARIGFHYRLRMMECTEEGRCDDGCGRDNNFSFVIHVSERPKDDRGETHGILPRNLFNPGFPLPIILDQKEVGPKDAVMDGE